MDQNRTEKNRKRIEQNRIELFRIQYNMIEWCSNLGFLTLFHPPVPLFPLSPTPTFPRLFSCAISCYSPPQNLVYSSTHVTSASTPCFSLLARHQSKFSQLSCSKQNRLECNGKEQNRMRQLSVRLERLVPKRLGKIDYRSDLDMSFTHQSKLTL